MESDHASDSIQLASCSLFCGKSFHQYLLWPKWGDGHSFALNNTSLDKFVIEKDLVAVVEVGGRAVVAGDGEPGVAVFGDALNWGRALGVAMIIGGVVVLKAMTP